jgi:hypothetical protein
VGYLYSLGCRCSKETLTLLGSGAVEYTAAIIPLNGHATTNGEYAELSFTNAVRRADTVLDSVTGLGRLATDSIQPATVGPIQLSGIAVARGSFKFLF